MRSAARPSRRFVRLAVLVAVLIGAAVGIGGYTFVYAKGYSYLTDDPAACANCHVMNEQYAGWTRASHRSVAVCNDCHTPGNFFGKYATKASNGFWHSFYFTVGGHPDPIQMTPRNRQITEGACQKCHAEIVSAIQTPHPGMPLMSCVRCHDSVGHLR
ncbi:MAG TPA: cytochrome c nitrite reductase small subunit [Vicinamibacterales bacterium]|jgi:cytochrome c nitrite reductase small subunit